MTSLLTRLAIWWLRRRAEFPIDVIANNGNRYVVRHSEGDEDDYLVIEQFLHREAPLPGSLEHTVDRYVDEVLGLDPEHPEGEPDDECDHYLLVPADVAFDLAAGLAAGLRHQAGAQDD